MPKPTIFELYNLSGKTAIVTGGAMGIGQGIAARLAEAGAAILIADIDLQEAEKTASDIRAEGGKAEAIKADASQVTEAEHVAQTAVDEFGSLDILVNNAGIYPWSPMLQITEPEWNQVLDLNLKGAFFFAQAAARWMVAGGRGGKIINIASIDSVHPSGNLAHYDATKGGIAMLTKSMALELGKYKINVNAVMPGGTQTPGGAKGAPVKRQLLGITEEQARISDQADLVRIPLGRVAVPDDIARVVLFFASDACEFVTGASLIVDGGYLLS
jgi:2-dehydro-3-deoxy-D-gluconate 5-dehydrogenase